jgi:hypothetical protein
MECLMASKKAGIVEIWKMSESELAELAKVTEWKSTHRIRTWEELPDNHPIYNAIGRVASEWAYYELVLDDIIRSLLNIDAMLTTSVTAQIMGVSNRFNAIKALCSLSANVQKKTESLRQRSYEPQDRRNRIVHDPWFFDPATQETGQFKSMPPKELKYGVKPVDAAFIDETLKLIGERTDEAKKLFEKVIGELVALRKRLPEYKPSSPDE